MTKGPEFILIVMWANDHDVGPNVEVIPGAVP
jgi:hypothetical protein